MNVEWFFDIVFTDIVKGSLIAAGALLVSNLALQWWNRPEIIIETGEISETEDGFIRVVVKNKGKTAAKNCAGKVSFDKVGKEDLLKNCSTMVISINPVRFRPIVKIPLYWTNTASENIIINAHDDEVLSIFEKVSCESEKAIAVGSRGFDARCVLKSLKGKEYRGKINITAANAKGKEINFRMKMEGDTIKMKLFNEC